MFRVTEQELPRAGTARAASTASLEPDALREGSPGRAEAIQQLRSLLRKAASHHIHRIPGARSDLGPVRIDEIIESAANMATMDVLAKLDRFEGRSRFTTWAYKFGMYHAATEVRRAIWKDRDTSLDDRVEPVLDLAPSPAAQVEASLLADAVHLAMRSVLTPHQERVAVAVLVEEIPIDVVAERLNTNRNAIYKTLHDARRRLRVELQDRGYLASERNEVGI